MGWELIHENNQKARKEHRCCFCGGIIKSGETYNRQTLKADGELYTFKCHLKCLDLTSELNMEHDGEGITDDLFMEYVREYIMDNVDEDSWENFDKWGEDAVDYVVNMLKEENYG